MLFSVRHHLGGSWELGSRARHSRPYCFTAGFSGAPNGRPFHVLKRPSGLVHRLGDISVLLGDGSGGFTPADGSPFAVGNGPAAVAVGDFDGDGNLDLAVANGITNNVTVLLGNGNGGFTEPASSPVRLMAAGAASSIAVADFDGDGRADLAVGISGGGEVDVLLGDGNADLVVANYGGGGDVTILLGDGRGGFPRRSSFSAGLTAKFVAVGDFNG